MLVTQDVLSETNNLLTYLSNKYKVSKPSFLFSSEIPFKAVYDTNLQTIIFNSVNPEIIVHEFFHHYLKQKNLPDSEYLVNSLTFKELEALKKEGVIPFEIEMEEKTTTPIFPITFSLLGMIFTTLSLTSEGSSLNVLSLLFYSISLLGEALAVG